MKEKLKNKKGSISVMGIIIALILVNSITYYLAILSSSWVLNEVQSIMELCATNTLQKSVDSEALKNEILSIGSEAQIDNEGNKKVNQSYVQNKLRGMYTSELNSLIKGNSVISSANLQYFDADLVYDSWGANYQGSSKQRPQLRMEAVVKMKVKTFTMVTADNFVKNGTFKSAKGTSFNYQIVGKANSGEMELIVTTLTRLLYK